MTPDTDTRLGDLIAFANREQALAHPLPVVGNAWFRHSDAGSCARSIAYKMAGLPPTNPPDLTSYHSFSVGHAVHELHQRAALDYLDETALVELEAVIPEGIITCARVENWRDGIWERVCSLHDRPLDADGACPMAETPRPLTGCHVDLVLYTAEGIKRAVEIKSVGAYAYDDAILKGRGPKFGHVLQASLNALAVGAEEAVVVYVPLNVISEGRADRKGVAPENRHGAQFTFPRHIWMPIADRELARVDWIRRTTLEKGPAAVLRWYSDHEEGPDDDPQVIRDPENTTWPCGYCPFRDLCIKEGP